MPLSVRIAKYLYQYPWILVVAIILVALCVKTFLILTNRFPFNSDEAVVGLMARHILQGERPVFFYGQAYMGSLDALLVAGAFFIMGEGVLAIRIVQMLLFCGVLATTYLLTFRTTENVVAGWIATLLIAIPTVNVTLYTTISLGGYGEALFLGNLLLLSGMWVIKEREWYGYLLLGILSGLGLWVNGLTLVYSIPVLTLIMWKHCHQRKNPKTYSHRIGLTLIFLGGMLGALPWWIYGMQNGFNNLLAELLGSAISNNSINYISSVGLRTLSILIFGLTVILGMRPPWEIRWLVLPFIPLIFGIWILVFSGIKKLVKKNPDLVYINILLNGIILVTIAGFILTPFGNDPSGRYFLPISIALAIMAGIYISNLDGRLIHWKWIILGVLVFYNIGGTIQTWLKNPPGFTTQFDSTTIYDQSSTTDLIDFLKSNSIDKGYSTYWVSYPLAFLSNEKLIFIPRLPYHKDFRYTKRDDRYPAYDSIVSVDPKNGYITARQPWLDSYLREHLNNINVIWQEKTIGDFTIFYQFSRGVLPEEIGLGQTAK